MSGRRIVTVDRLTLRLPKASAHSGDAIVQEVSRVIRENARFSTDSLQVVMPAAPAGEGAVALAQRVGRATGASLKQWGGA
ncbi:MAG: hypothetical protein AB8B58_05725 [Roseobacter sp.]